MAFQSKLTGAGANDMCNMQVRGRARAVAPPLDIGQLPLPRRLRDLARDVAVQRVARQHDLGTARIVEHQVEHARVVVMEIAKTTDPLRLPPDRTDEPRIQPCARRLACGTREGRGTGAAQRGDLATSSSPRDKVIESVDLPQWIPMWIFLAGPSRTEISMI